MSWFKARAGQADFAKDRYNCLRETQQPSGTALILGPNGAAMTGIITNDQLFGACMNAKGWVLTPAR
jgi:hypothetical protein